MIQLLTFRTLAACALLLLAACSRPQPPEKERPPEPKAQASSALRDAINEPLDKAKGVEDQLQKDKDAQDAAIEAAGG